MVYLFWAYWVVWMALVLYLVWLHHRVTHLQRELERLSSEVRERAGVRGSAEETR